jgi:hypothetical protein
MCCHQVIRIVYSHETLACAGHPIASNGHVFSPLPMYVRRTGRTSYRCQAAIRLGKRSVGLYTIHTPFCPSSVCTPQKIREVGSTWYYGTFGLRRLVSVRRESFFFFCLFFTIFYHVDIHQIVAGHLCMTIYTCRTVYRSIGVYIYVCTYIHRWEVGASDPQNGATSA